MAIMLHYETRRTLENKGLYNRWINQPFFKHQYSSKIEKLTILGSHGSQSTFVFKS